MTIDPPQQAVLDFMDKQKAFERKIEVAPVEIIIEFLQFFSDHSKNNIGDIRQDCPVEKYVLEALAKRLHAFVYSKEKGGTLDAAFGGKVKRQLQQIRADDKAYGVAFHIKIAMQNGRTHEQAVADLSKESNMAPDTIRDLYKRAGQTGRRKRGGKSK